jgi:hypothetical protein
MSPGRVNFLLRWLRHQGVAVTGASTTANDVIATARPLASTARPGASATVTDVPIGNRTDDFSPRLDASPAILPSPRSANHRTVSDVRVRGVVGRPFRS